MGPRGGFYGGYVSLYVQCRGYMESGKEEFLEHLRNIVIPSIIVFLSPFFPLVNV